MAQVEIEVIGKDSFSGVLGNIGNIFTGIESAINLVKGAFDAAAGAITPFVNAAIESQDAVAELEAVLKATGGAAGLSSQELQDMAGALQNVTRFGDETIMSGQAMLLTFRNIGEDTFPRAVESMLDMAEMFGSVDTAAIQLGKALNDPIAGIGALQRIGIQFTDEQKEMIENFVKTGDVAAAQNIILKEVEMQIGGLAEAMGQTFAGKVEILKNRFGEIQEVIGKAVLPILGDLAQVVLDNMPAIERFGQNIADWLTNLRESGVIQDFANRVGDLLGKVINLASAFVDAGVNSSEFREALSAIIGDSFQIDAATIIGWMDQFDAALASGVRSHDWSESGAAFGNLLDSLMGTGLDFGSQDSQAIPAIADALNRWLLGAIGAVSWEQWRQAAGENLKNAILGMIDFARFDAIQDAWRQIGADIVAGLSAGLSFENMRNNITTFINNVINYFKSLLGISSPSTVFSAIGRDIVQGLINGFLGMIGTLTNAIGSIIDAILGPFAPVLDLLGISVGGGSGNVGLDPTDPGTIGGRTPITGDDRTPLLSGTGGIINNFYGPVFFGDMGQLGYDCPSPHPLMTASSQSLLTTVSIG